jgi:hypothetical protein
MLLQTLSYTDTVRSISRGAFDTIGITGPMVRMEAVANGYSALGWAIALGLSFSPHAHLAPRIIYVLAGMMWFDVLTTWPLDMPLPDGFLYWGSLVVALQLGIAGLLERHFGSMVPDPYRGPARYAALLFAAIFGYSAFTLGQGAFADSDIPQILHQPHLAANLVEAAGWLIVFALAASRHVAWAARLALFLLGMWFWDMVTTLPLAMPVPAAQQVWGPLSTMLMAAVVVRLLPSRDSTHRTGQ